ncbi:unnamed protein product, partial [Schistosoma turkestanicum]
NYDCLDSATSSNNIPDQCDQLFRLFKSEAMLVILGDITGIQLHPLILINNDDNTTTDVAVNHSNIVSYTLLFFLLTAYDVFS